jgi:hypothetical protein
MRHAAKEQAPMMITPGSIEKLGVPATVSPLKPEPSFAPK